MKSSPTDIMIFFRDMETLPVAATVSGISFVNSIVFSTNSSNNEISSQLRQMGAYFDGLSDGMGDGEFDHVILSVANDEYVVVYTRRICRRHKIIKRFVLSTFNRYH